MPSPLPCIYHQYIETTGDARPVSHLNWPGFSQLFIFIILPLPQREQGDGHGYNSKYNACDTTVSRAEMAILAKLERQVPNIASRQEIRQFSIW